MAKKERDERDQLLDIVEEVKAILSATGLEGKFTTYAHQKPYLVEVFFFATLDKVVEVVRNCEDKYGSRAELGFESAEPMPAPCTISHEYYLDITCE